MIDKKKIEGAAVALLFQSNWLVLLIGFRGLEVLSIRLALDSCKAR